MKTRVHVNLNVRDLDRSVAFYRTLFGAEPSKTRADYANFRLDSPALHLALVHKPDHQPIASEQHFGVELFEDGELEGWRERVEAAGVSTRIEEAVTCCYAVANKFWAQDPDGNEWEFWVRHADAEAMSDKPAGSSECCAPAASMPLSTIAGLEPKQSDGGCCG